MIASQSSTTAAVVLVGGPAGIGKTSAVNSLLKRLPSVYFRPISYTSRIRRPSDGNEYEFVSREEVLSLEMNGLLFNLDEVYGNLYGMSRPSVEEILQKGGRVIREIHPSNHFKIKAAHSGTLSILLLPASDWNGYRKTFERPDTKARQTADSDYFGQLDSAKFDAVIHVAEHEAVEEVADRIHNAVQLLVPRHE